MLEYCPVCVHLEHRAGLCPVCIDLDNGPIDCRPSPMAETSGADRDDDRLATELFRRYGSVRRGEWRAREHWLDDAAAVRHIVGFERLIGAIGEPVVHVNRGHGEEAAKTWSDGFDEGWSQAWSARIHRAVVVAIIAGLLLMFLIGRATAPRPPAQGSTSPALIQASSVGTPAPASGAPQLSDPATSEIGAPTHLAGGRWSDPTALKSDVPKSVRAGHTVPRGYTVRGIASTYGPGWDGWIAWPNGPGWRLRVCGPAACRTVVSTDAGPDKAMQRAGRVIDLDIPTFEAIAGGSWRRGLVHVTVTVLGRG